MSPLSSSVYGNGPAQNKVPPDQSLATLRAVCGWKTWLLCRLRQSGAAGSLTAAGMLWTTASGPCMCEPSGGNRHACPRWVPAGRGAGLLAEWLLPRHAVFIRVFFQITELIWLRAIIRGYGRFFLLCLDHLYSKLFRVVTGRRASSRRAGFDPVSVRPRVPEDWFYLWECVRLSLYANF